MSESITLPEIIATVRRHVPAIRGAAEAVDDADNHGRGSVPARHWETLHAVVAAAAAEFWEIESTGPHGADTDGAWGEILEVAGWDTAQLALAVLGAMHGPKEHADNSIVHAYTVVRTARRIAEELDAWDAKWSQQAAA